jgi:hypothetical protein
MTYYTFHNVTVSIRAENGKQAYTKLCDMLVQNNDGDWYTDTFSEEDSQPRSTRELFPEPTI